MLFKAVCMLSIFDPDVQFDLFFVQDNDDPIFIGSVVGKFLPLFGSFYIDCISYSDLSNCPGIYLKDVSND